ncbi:hypothetical protein DFH06DRAFT_1142764 [Mycena polygramma]|nr:hypothetical protein DFH06DRAFT_1142764 [Mycena polygramma]
MFLGNQVGRLTPDPPILTRPSLYTWSGACCSLDATVSLTGMWGTSDVRIPFASDCAGCSSRSFINNGQLVHSLMTPTITDKYDPQHAIEVSEKKSRQLAWYSKHPKSARHGEDPTTPHEREINPPEAYEHADMNQAICFVATKRTELSGTDARQDGIHEGGSCSDSKASRPGGPRAGEQRCAARYLNGSVTDPDGDSIKFIY